MTFDEEIYELFSYACENSMIHVIPFLLNNGYNDKMIIDGYSHAVANGDLDVMELLENYGANRINSDVACKIPYKSFNHLVARGYIFNEKEMLRVYETICQDEEKDQNNANIVSILMYMMNNNISMEELIEQAKREESLYLFKIMNENGIMEDERFFRILMEALEMDVSRDDWIIEMMYHNVPNFIDTLTEIFCSQIKDNKKNNFFMVRHEGMEIIYAFYHNTANVINFIIKKDESSDLLQKIREIIDNDQIDKEMKTGFIAFIKHCQINMMTVSSLQNSPSPLL